MPASERTTPVLEDPYAPGAPQGWFAEVGAAIGHIQRHLAGPPAPRIPWEACHPVPILGTVSASPSTGATLDQPDMYGPKDPYWWDLRDLAAWGFTAGTVTVFLNSTNGQQVAAASTPGEFTWSAQRLLAPRDRLIFVSAGITGTVQLGGQAIEIATDWLPEYLM